MILSRTSTPFDSHQALDEDNRSVDDTESINALSIYACKSVFRHDSDAQKGIDNEGNDEAQDTIAQLPPSSPLGLQSRKPRLSFLGNSRNKPANRVAYQKPAAPPKPQLTEAELYRKENYTKGALSEMRVEKLSRFMHSSIFGDHGSLTEESLIANSALSQMTLLRDQYRSVYGPLPELEEETSMKLAANYLFEQTKIQLAAIKIQRAFRRFFKSKYGYDLSEVNPLDFDEGFEAGKWDFVDRMMADRERRLVTLMVNEEERDDVPQFETALRGGALTAKASKTPRSSYMGEPPGAMHGGKHHSAPKRGWVGGTSTAKTPSSPPLIGAGGNAISKFSSIGPRYGPLHTSSHSKAPPVPPSRLSQGQVLASTSMPGPHPSLGVQSENSQARPDESELDKSHLVRRKMIGENVLSRGLGTRSLGAVLQKFRFKDPVLQHRLEMYKHHTRWLSRWEERQMHKQVAVINKIEEMQERWRLMGLIPSNKPSTPQAEDTELLKNLADDPLKTPLRARRPSAGSYRASEIGDRRESLHLDEIDLSDSVRKKRAQSALGEDFFDNDEEEDDDEDNGMERTLWSSKSKSVGMDRMGLQGGEGDGCGEEEESIGAQSREVIQGSIWCGDDQDEEEEEVLLLHEEKEEEASTSELSRSSVPRPNSLRAPSGISARAPSHLVLDVASLHSLRVALLSQGSHFSGPSPRGHSHLTSRLHASSFAQAPIQAAPMQAAPMQAAPMQAPMQAAPIQAAPMQAAPMQAPMQAPPSHPHQDAHLPIPSSSNPSLHDPQEHKTIEPPPGHAAATAGHAAATAGHTAAAADNDDEWADGSIVSQSARSIVMRAKDGPALMPQFTHSFTAYKLLREASSLGNSILIRGLLDTHDWEPRDVSSWIREHVHLAVNDDGDTLHGPMDPLPPPATVLVEPVIDFDEDMHAAEDLMMGGLGLSRKFRPMESHLFTYDSRGGPSPPPPHMGLDMIQKPHPSPSSHSQGQQTQQGSHQAHALSSADLYSSSSTIQLEPSVLPGQSVAYRGLLSLAHSKGMIPDREWGRIEAPSTQILTESFKRDLLMRDEERLNTRGSDPNPVPSRHHRSLTEGGLLHPAGGNKGIMMNDLSLHVIQQQQQVLPFIQGGPCSSPLRARVNGPMHPGAGAWGSPDDYRRLGAHVGSEGGGSIKKSEGGGSIKKSERIEALSSPLRRSLAPPAAHVGSSSSPKQPKKTSFLPRLTIETRQSSDLSSPPWLLPPIPPSHPLDSESSPGGSSGGFFPPLPTSPLATTQPHQPHGHSAVKGIYDHPGNIIDSTSTLVKLFPRQSPFWAILSSQQRTSLIGAPKQSPRGIISQSLPPKRAYVSKRKGEIVADGCGLAMDEKTSGDAINVEASVGWMKTSREGGDDSEARQEDVAIKSQLQLQGEDLELNRMQQVSREGTPHDELQGRISSELGEPYEAIGDEGSFSEFGEGSVSVSVAS